MRFLLIISMLFGFITVSFAKNLVHQNLIELQRLNPDQRIIMNKTFMKAKEFDLQLTMTAIAWHESHFGELAVNFYDPSCGVFHIYLPDINKRMHRKDNFWNRNKICTKLVQDYDFSFSQALGRLKFWENYWKSKGYSGPEVWRRMVMSYNGGTNYKNGKEYYKHIVSKIRALKLYGYK